MLALSGLLAGVLSGLVGVGGGVVMVPAMVSSPVGMSHRAAGANSLAAIVPISLVGTLAYAAHGDVDAVAVAGVVPGSVLGAVLGAVLAPRIGDRRLALGFAALGLASAVRLAVPAGLPDHGHPLTASALTLAMLLGLGLVVGLLSGLLGVGGGILVVPALVLGFGVGQHLAQGTSLATIVLTGAAGTLGHARLGAVDYRAVGALAVGGVVGTLAGATAAVHLGGTPLRLLFAGCIAVVSVRIIWRRRRS